MNFPSMIRPLGRITLTTASLRGALISLIASRTVYTAGPHEIEQMLYTPYVYGTGHVLN